ncbi:S8/S53 family peptidase [Phytoactinopolyspora limicola]|uniref:S8/S53 family peptidase n=1 Tax=Phytoactinopolyspora limicola TaxID=2715536 RepID=UPI00140789C3|nr:S8/S53 family peptidase [Phytoactinopolyspora limicola]
MSGRRVRREELAREVERLERNCAARTQGRQFPLAVRWDPSGNEVEYLYRNHQLICDVDDLDETLEAFDRVGAERPEAITDGPVGLKVLDVGDRDAADLAEQLLGVVDEDVVGLNYVLDTQGNTVMCPVTEPLPWNAPVPVLGEPVGPGRPRLAVIDTGYHPPVAEQSGFARFSAVKDNHEPDDEVYFDDGSTIRPYGGHGTAAAARLLAVSGSESVTVQVRDCLVGGAVDELTIVNDLDHVVRAGVDVVSVQAGLYARPGCSPKAFNAFYRRVLRRHPDTVIVVAAGNNGSDAPFWPAAYPWTIAVGALTDGGDSRAGWSNVGHWVGVYASGENAVVPFPNGTYEYLDGTRAEFSQGHALWSGTSFAAPVVAGMIARRMVERGVTAPVARDIVLAEAEIAALDGVGPRLVLP